MRRYETQQLRAETAIESTFPREHFQTFPKTKETRRPQTLYTLRSGLYTVNRVRKDGRRPSSEHATQKFQWEA